MNKPSPNTPYLQRATSNNYNLDRIQSIERVDTLRVTAKPNAHLQEASAASGSNRTDYEPETRPSSIYDTTSMPPVSRTRRRLNEVFRIFRKYLTFIGPGFLIAVSYIDPGNYSTDVSAGALFQYKMLFILLLTNGFAIFLQSLSCKLGCVTGYNLPELCREQFPLWANVILYVIFEVAILATDLAEVIGTAIALNILFKIPLVAGVAITMIDVLIVLFAWRPDGSMRAVRIFEIGVALLVVMVIGCFIALLTKTKGSASAILKGYLPNSTAFSSEGIYTSLSIMGAVVMPHSLILGTGLTQPRMRQWDISRGFITKDVLISDTPDSEKYKPSIGAVKSTLSYSVVELSLSLMTFALFVNSAILIVAGSTLYKVDGAADADLFGIHDLLSTLLAPVAGTLFAVALLASGQSAGIVVTMAGQIVSEGFFRWTIRPWLRRMITRSIAILPCIVVAGIVGRSGLSTVLNASQVALSILLPFITFPIVLFTGKRQIMKVASASRPRPSIEQLTREDGTQRDSEEDDTAEVEVEYTYMTNSVVTQFFGWAIWATITGLNVYLIVILASTGGTGK